MGRVFHSKTTKWFRFKYWARDTFKQVTSLPSYLWPKPLKAFRTELTEEENNTFQELKTQERIDIDEMLKSLGERWHKK